MVRKDKKSEKHVGYVLAVRPGLARDPDTLKALDQANKLKDDKRRISKEDFHYFLQSIDGYENKIKRKARKHALKLVSTCKTM